MAVVDTLVTRFVLDNKDYQAGAKQIEGATQRLSAGFSRATALAQGIGAAMAAVGTGVAASGGYAVKAASDWEVLISQLAVVTGSFERAKQVAKFADDLALPSAFFDTATLAETAKLLETLQLNTERFLPLANTMASLFGGSSDKLKEFAMALGRLKAGVFGEAFERMREFGISAKDLTAEGLTFKAGQFQLLDGESAAEGADRALAAVEAVIKKRFGNMDDIMGSTMSARFATLGETFSKAFRIAGNAINERLKKPFGQFVDGVLNFINGPTFKSMAAQFAGLFDFEKMKDGAIKAVATIVAAFNQLPLILSSLKDLVSALWKPGIEALKIYISWQAAAFGFKAIQAMQAAYTVMKGIATQVKLQAVFTAVIAALNPKTIGLVAGAALIGGLTYGMLTSMEKGSGPNPLEAVGWDNDAFKADRDRIERELRGSPEGGAPSTPEGLIEQAIKAAEARKSAMQNSEMMNAAGAGASSELEQQTGYLAAIERNTNPQRNTILGGGNLGAKGITPVELAGKGRSKIDRAVKLIREAVSEEAAMTTAAMIRSSAPFIVGR